HHGRSLLDRDLHPLLSTVAEAVVGLVHRAEVLERDVVAVVEALDERGEIPRVRGLAPQLETAAAGLAVRRELRRRAVDETGEDRHPLLLGGLQERPTRRVGVLLLGRSRGRVHTAAATADVVA